MALTDPHPHGILKFWGKAQEFFLKFLSDQNSGEPVGLARSAGFESN